MTFQLCTNRDISTWLQHRPIALLASDRNSEAVEFIKPKPVHGPSLSVSQYHRFANKLGSSPFEFDKNCAGSRLSGCHGGLLDWGLAKGERS